MAAFQRSAEAQRDAADALAELGGRIAAAGTQTEISRLNALQTTISTMDRLGLRYGEAGVSGQNGLMLGAYTFVYAQARGEAEVGSLGVRTPVLAVGK